MDNKATESVCKACRGKKKIDGKSCITCRGTGKSPGMIIRK